MRILIIINSLEMGGAEKLVVDSILLYQKMGLEVDVLCLSNKKSLLWIELETQIKGKMIGLTEGSVYNPWLIFKIIPYLFKYELIHVHLFPSLYWAVLGKWLSFSKKVFIYTEHSTSNRRRKSLVFKLLDRLIYSGLSKVITISEEVDLNLKHHLGYDNNKFVLVQNGVDVQKFSNARPHRKDLFFSGDDFVLIQVSSFREQKDQPTLIKALRLLPGRVKLLLIGEGKLRQSCEVLVEELNLMNRVKFLGLRNDVDRLLKTADIVILSSYHEGLSLSSIEGMSSRPFIASNVPGLREIVKGYGLLFNLGDEKDLAGHIKRLYEDKEFYQIIANRCQERSKQFDINDMVNKYIEVYNNTLYEQYSFYGRT